MERVKVLMVLGSTEMGGAQAFVQNVLQNIDLGRFQIDIAVNTVVEEGGFAREWRKRGCCIYTLPYFKVGNYFAFTRKWRAFLREHHYDIVHGHSSNSASVYLRIAKEAGCATIVHSHSAGYRGGLMERLVKRWFARRAGRVADYWFACSDKAAERLFGPDYRSYNHYYNIPNAINVENYRYDAEKALAIRRQIGATDGEWLCGHVGSFSAPKNHGFLLDIFAEVLKRKPQAKLVCCGTGELMPQMKAKAAALGIADRVVFTGVVKNVNEYMMAMDVLLFPSLFEGFPMAVIEAEATGLPVVMSDVITGEVDLTDLTHRLSLGETASAWADAVCRVEPARRPDYHRVVAQSPYNMQTCVRKISSLYEEMANHEKILD